MLDYFDLGAVRLHDVAFTTRSAVKVSGLSGFPAPRGDAFSRPDVDGGVEPRAQYAGMRFSTLEGETWAASIAAAMTDWDTLTAAFEAAARNQVLVKWRKAGGVVGVDDRQGYARLAADATVVFDEGDMGAFVHYLAQFRHADPRWYSTVLQTALAAAPSASGGMPLPVVFPIPFGAGASGGTVTVTSAGLTDTWPLITIQGPIVNPIVANLTQAKALYFDQVVLASTDSLVIDTNPATRSALVGGVSVLGGLRWSASSFFSLSPGVAQTIQFQAQGGGTAAGTTMTVAWRDAYFS